MFAEELSMHFFYYLTHRELWNFLGPNQLIYIKGFFIKKYHKWEMQAREKHNIGNSAGSIRLDLL